MKLLNLLPQSIQRKRLIMRYRKIAYWLISIPIVIFGSIMYFQSNLKTEVEELKVKQNQAQAIQKQIQQEMAKKSNLQQDTSTTIQNPIAYNQFLLFLGTEVPEDIQLYSIENQMVLQNPTNEHTTTSPDATAPADSNAQLQDNNQLNNDQSDTQQDSIKPTSNNKQKDRKNPIRTETGDIIKIKAIALSVPSVSYLVQMIELQPYVKKVELGPIKNHYDGHFHFKVFEITVNL